MTLTPYADGCSRVPGRSLAQPRRRSAGFTLLEVMIAGGILFVCLFAILGLVSNSLRNARALQNQRADAGMAAAYISVVVTNLQQGPASGDFGELFPDYEWEYRDAEEVGTNGLWMVHDLVLHQRSGGQVADSPPLTILLYQPSNRARSPGVRR